MCLLVLGLIFTGYKSVDAQTNNLDLSEFHTKITTDVGLEQIKDALKSAEKRSEPLLGKRNAASELSARSHLELGMLRKHALVVLQKKITEFKIPAKDELSALIPFFHANAQKTRMCFENAIRILESNLKTENPDLVSAKFELGALTESYDPKLLEPLNLREKRKRLENAQELYEQAILINERIHPKTSKIGQAIRSRLARSYAEAAEFEKALPHFRRLIDEITKNEAGPSPDLLPILNVTSAIALLTGEQALANTIAKQISLITKNVPDLSNFYFDLTLRADLTNQGINEPPFVKRLSRPLVEYRLEHDPKSLSSTRTIVRSENLLVSSPIQGRGFPVIVTVETDGTVIDADCQTENDVTNKKVEKIVRRWKFRPFIYNGTAKRIKGLVYFWVDDD